MIFISYYAENNLENLGEKQNVKTMKIAEMIVVLYHSLRFFCGQDVPIFILDNDSPIPLTKYLANFNEKFIILNSDNYTYNEQIKLYIKTFKEEKRDVHLSYYRSSLEFLKYAYVNNLDRFYIDMDVCLCYDVVSDCTGYDFCAYGINYYKRNAATFFSFVSNEQLHRTDIFCNLMDWIEYVKNNFPLKIHLNSIIGYEGILYRNFCYGKTKSFSQPVCLLHNSYKNELLEFLSRMEPLGFKNNYIKEFVNKIKKNDRLI